MTNTGELDIAQPLALQEDGVDGQPLGWWPRVRRWMTWRTLLAVLLVVHIAPIWIVTYFPTQDGPAHIYNSRIFFDQFDRSNYQIRQFYDFGYQLYPNILSHLMLGVLQQVVPALIAEKVVVSVIVGLVPLSLLYLLNSIERGRGVLCFIGFTFAYHNLLHIGFYNFSLSVSMCLFALGWWWRYKEAMTLPRLAGFYLLAALTYTSHFAGFMALVLAMTITVAWSVLLRLLTALIYIRRGEFKADIKRMMVWGVGMAGILLPLWAIGWDYNFRHYLPEQDGYRTMAQLREVFEQTLTLMSYSEWRLKLDGYGELTLAPIVLWTMAGIAGITVLYRVGRLTVEFYRLRSLRVLHESDALILICGALVYLYFTLPWSRNAGGWVNDRLYILAFLLAWAWFGRFHKFVNVIVGIALLAISLAHTGKLAMDYRALQPDLHELAAAVDKIEPHSTVNWELNSNYRSPDFPEGTKLVNPWLHALSYYGLKKDIALYSNYEAGFPYFLTRWGEAERRDPDYVVAFGTADDPERVKRFLSQYEIVQQSTNLSLLRRKQSAPDMGPWTKLPDGRMSTKLNMGRRNPPAGMQRAVRERLFNTGSFGWVRTIPRREWRNASPAAGEYGDLVGDERDRTFRIDLPNGRYNVTCHFAPSPVGMYETRVIANDQKVGQATVAFDGIPQAIHYTVDVTAGQLTQTFYTPWRGSPDPDSSPNARRLKFWGISGIDIEQAAPLISDK